MFDKLREGIRFSGRATRMEYLLRTVRCWSLISITLLAVSRLNQHVMPIVNHSIALAVPIALIAGACVLYLLGVQIAVAVRRCHDCGWSGWGALIMGMPMLGFFVLTAKAGQDEANRYGEPI